MTNTHTPLRRGAGRKKGKERDMLGFKAPSRRWNSKPLAKTRICFTRSLSSPHQFHCNAPSPQLEPHGLLLPAPYWERYAAHSHYLRPTNQQVYPKTPPFPTQSAGQQMYPKTSPLSWAKKTDRTTRWTSSLPDCQKFILQH